MIVTTGRWVRVLVGDAAPEPPDLHGLGVPVADHLGHAE
jgi:hypothetical protein